MRFICLGYINEEQWDAMSSAQQESQIKECVAYDEELRDARHMAGGNCLDSAKLAVTVSQKDGQVLATDGPFAETKEAIGGILELEADSLQQAVEIIKKHPGLQIGPFEVRQVVSLPHSKSDEEQIRELVSQWSDALSARDLDGMMRHYDDDAVLFDACPPYKTVGKDGIRQVWENCLPFFPESFRSEHRDLVVEVDGGCAFVYGVHHFVAEPADHPCAQSWMRVSVGFRKKQGRWLLVHEHVSMPFNPRTGQMWPIPSPDQLSLPDYAQACGAGADRP